MSAEKHQPDWTTSLQSLLATVVIAVFVITFIVQAFQIPSESMENTLLIGDYLLVDKLRYGGNSVWDHYLPYRKVNRGDIIVFRYPVNPSQHFVKRVVGVPGDHIRLINRQVYVNEIPLQEPYVRYSSRVHDAFRDEFPRLNIPVPGLEGGWWRQMKKLVDDNALTVPEGSYFVLGDNRDESLDSRYWGLVPRENTVEFLASLAAVLVTGLFLITFVVQAFEIPSSSMENTLLIGDHVFVNRVQFAPRTNWVGPLLPYGQIHHGDIVVFLSPAQPGLYIVKRIIGIPGDRIHLRDGAVYRNGEKLNEPYVIHSSGEYNPYRDNFPAVPPSDFNNVTPAWQLTLPQHIQGDDLVIPPDSYFGMGDNRDVSLDSRFWGFIPKENVIGRPMFVYWSFETPPNQYQHTAVSERLGFLALVVIHFFDETRWRRTLRMVRLDFLAPDTVHFCQH